jgi:acetylglutamate kinase
MQKLIEKAGVLIEALPYIQRFRGEIVVVKFGGSAMEDPSDVADVLADVTFMECVGMLPVVVHGGGKAISRGMAKEGIEARFVKGLRVTCERTIKVVERVLKHEINPGIVAALRKLGARAQGVHGDELFRVSRVKGRDEATGEMLDWGYVGEPVRCRTAAIRALLKRNTIPVITPLGLGPDGKVHNVNADSAAAAVAKALKVRKLAYLSDVPGLMRDPADPSSIIPTVRASEVEKLIEKGVIKGGMIPKMRSAVEALRAGVRKVHIVDGRMSHSLLLEIFTDQGVGTEIVPDEQK